VRAVGIGFRLLSGATAPHAKPTGACVEIVFVGIRLCDRLIYPGPGPAVRRTLIAAEGAGLWARVMGDEAAASRAA
jgi:hypothetical protein